jgi:hypothetical protein
MNTVEKEKIRYWRGEGLGYKAVAAKGWSAPAFRSTSKVRDDLKGKGMHCPHNNILT